MPSYKRMHQIPAADRPREKLVRKGVASLSDFELYEVLIGNGSAGTDVGQIARNLQKVVRNGYENLSVEILTSIRGISIAHASKLLAALELAKRHLTQDTLILQNISDILSCLSDIATKQQEYFVCMSLDGAHRLIAQRTISIGTLDSVLAHPREVFSDAIADRAASIIVAHNHPSGDVQPSQQDTALTHQLAAAGQLIGIPLRDHVIIAKANYYSYRQHHML